MSIKKMKGAKGKCDSLVSKIIRSRGSCERCGKRDYLQTSHIISRRYSATRCDILNLQCLCAGCHRWFTDNPVDFTRWIFATIGEQEYDRLAAKARLFTKVNWDDEYIRLKILYDNLPRDWIVD
jgi:hypothetical protein